jgi:hypothetical protein
MAGDGDGRAGVVADYEVGATRLDDLGAEGGASPGTG